MKTVEQNREEAAVLLKALREQNRMARRLLTRALDVIPDCIDGRNDRLCNMIVKWLGKEMKPVPIK